MIPRPSQWRLLPPKDTQFQLPLDVDALKGLSTQARERAIAELANLLLLAAGVHVRERDDDERL